MRTLAGVKSGDTITQNKTGIRYQVIQSYFNERAEFTIVIQRTGDTVSTALSLELIEKWFTLE